MDNRHIQIYMYRLCISINIQKGTDIIIDSHTDRELHKVLHRQIFALLLDIRLIGKLQYLRLFEMYVSVVFVIRCLYSAVSLTLVREQHFIKIMYYYYYYCY